LNKSNTSLNVEDISGDEISLTSVKGEGEASEISDNETLKNNKYPHHHYLTQRTSRLKKNPVINTEQNSQRRPTTPMDIRNQDQQQQQQQKNLRQIVSKSQEQSSDLNTNFRGMSIRNQQIGEQHQVSNRFNEWDPFSSSRQQQMNSERQKSPQKTKQYPQQSQLQQQQSSNFAHTFLSTDSSPRQTSGRSQVGSANNQKLQISPQHNSNSVSSINNSNQADANQLSNLELVVSGQKLGGRKEVSPTSTPRDLSQFQQPQSLRPFTRRLQPLDKIALELQIQQQQQQILANTSNEGQFLKPKK
jgi:hypothetical protein